MAQKIEKKAFIGVLIKDPKLKEVFLKHGYSQVNDPAMQGRLAAMSIADAFKVLGLPKEKQEALLKDLNDAASKT